MEYLGYFGQYVSDVITISVKCLYPAYVSFKAIKSEGKDDDSTWLIYFVVMALSSFIETYLVPFVSWVPCFMLARILYYIWLQLPYFNGSVFLFKKIFQPFFVQHKELFDTLLPGSTENTAKTIQMAKTSVVEVYTQIYAHVASQQQ